MLKRYRISKNLFLAVAISSIASYLGIATGNEGLKYIAVICQVYAIVKSISVIDRFRSLIKRKYVMVVATIVFFPLIRILLYAASGFEFKALTDALIIYGGYYELIFPGLAIALLAGRTLGLLILYKYALYALPVGILLMLYAINSQDVTNIGIGHTALTNCFIPAALLTLYPRNKRYLLLGGIAIVLILFLSSRIWSRSYTLVGFYLLVMSFITMFKMGQKKIGLSAAAIILFAYFVGAFSFFTQESVVQEVSISDKYQFESLGKSISQFFKDGDFVKLFNWEGNSRAEIVVDAFGRFDFIDWMFGKGLAGTYTSFVERSTIEIGWAQELFRWGLLYMVSFLLLLLYVVGRMRKKIVLKSSPIYAVLSSIVIVRFLDGFVLGLPQSTVYNLLVFWGIMTLAVKQDPVASIIIAKKARRLYNA